MSHYLQPLTQMCSSWSVDRISPVNRVGCDNLASLFGPCLFHSPQVCLCSFVPRSSNYPYTSVTLYFLLFAELQECFFHVSRVPVQMLTWARSLIRTPPRLSWPTSLSISSTSFKYELIAGALFGRTEYGYSLYIHELRVIQLTL